MTVADLPSTLEPSRLASVAARTGEVLLRDIHKEISGPPSLPTPSSNSYVGWAWNMAKDVVRANLPELAIVDNAPHQVLGRSTEGPSLTRLTEPGDYRETLNVGGTDRTFMVHVPPSKNKGRPKPVVVMLHGITENGASFAERTQMNKKADEEGFIAVYPDGSKMLSTDDHRAWNVANWGLFHRARKADDVAFIKGIIDQLPKQTPVDRDRVYLCGFSNGGMLAQQVAVEMPDKIAAVALVGADLSGKDMAPTQAMSVLDIHGTRDVTDYGALLDGMGVLNIQTPGYTFAFWRQANNIVSNPKVRTAGGLTTLESVNPTTGAEVKQVFIDGGSHTWPGPQAMRPEDRQFSATDAVWNFFATHTRSGKIASV